MERMIMMMMMMQTLEMRRMRGQGAARPGAKISVGSMSTDITDIGSSGTGFYVHISPVHPLSFFGIKLCLHTFLHHVKVAIQWILGLDLTPGPGLTRSPSPGGRGERDMIFRCETLGSSIFSNQTIHQLGNLSKKSVENSTFGGG